MRGLGATTVAKKKSASGPLFISKADGAKQIAWSGNHSCSWSHVIPAGLTKGALLVPIWINASSWVGISEFAKTLSTSLGDGFTDAGYINCYSSGGGERHGGIQLYYKLNPTAGTPTINLANTHWDAFQVLGGGSLLYSGVGSITNATGSGNQVYAANTRTLNIASAVGRLTLGLFASDGVVPVGNGISRWVGDSGNYEGWADHLLLQELPGAASVAHTITNGSGGAVNWGIGFDLVA